MTANPYPPPVPALSGTEVLKPELLPSGGVGSYIRFATIAAEWLAWLEEVKRLAPRSVHAYRSTLNQYVVWFENHGHEWPINNPCTPSLEQLEAFIARPRRRQGKGSHGKPATRRAEMVALRSVFAWAVARGKLSADPTLDLVGPKVPKKKPHPIPYNTWLRFHTEPFDSIKLFVASGLGYVCGLRASEVWSLRGSQLHGLDLRYVKRKGDKEDETHTVPWGTMLNVYTQRMPQLFPRANEWGEELRWWCKHKKDARLFDGEPQNFHRAIYRRCDKLEIPRFRAHDLRDSCASNLVNTAGVPLHLVMELMNHSSIDMTARYVETAGKVDDWLLQQSPRDP